MRRRLERAPVLTGGHRHRIDAVHDALVVCGGAVGVVGGQAPGFFDPLSHLHAAESFVRELRGRYLYTPIAIPTQTCCVAVAQITHKTKCVE